MIPKIWDNKDAKDSNPWWEFSAAVDEFNQHHRDLIQASRWKVEDESMSAWCPHKPKTGGLPNISYVIQAPEPLGMFFCFVFYSLFLSTLFLYLFFFLFSPRY